MDFKERARIARQAMIESIEADHARRGEPMDPNIIKYQILSIAELTAKLKGVSYVYDERN